MTEINSHSHIKHNVKTEEIYKENFQKSLKWDSIDIIASKLNFKILDNAPREESPLK